MTNDPIIQEMIDKTMRELAQPIEEKQVSRAWQDPEGYRYLLPWSNAVLLRYFIRLYTENLPKPEYRRKAQVDDAGRSMVRNIEEGFKRATTKEYLEFLGFSQGSLEEVKGDTRESAEDGFLKSVPGSSLERLGINLKEFSFALRKPRQQYRTKLEEGLKENLKEGLKDNLGGNLKESLGDGKGSLSPKVSSNDSSNFSSNVFLPPEEKFAYHDITDLYPPLKKIKAEDLTYEIFMELINKTDYLLRQLVVSLENKLNNDKKYYQVEQIRLNRRARGG